jgi:hypothetical protein
VPASAPVADLDSRFLQQVGAPASGEARILPLILKDKVAALLYADNGNADSGTDAAGSLDAGSLELLVLSTSAWLEVNSLRKQAQAHIDSRSVPAAEPAPFQAPTPPVPRFNDPFGSHAPAFAPGHAMAAAASAEAPASVSSPAFEAAIPTMAAESATAEVQSAAVEMDPVLAERLPIGHAHTETAPEAAPETPLTSSASPEDQDVHRKAQRFARLLVDEIKLYNQAKVAEGRKNNNLYDRLKEAIEKSRATYQKRYGNTVAASANYFQHEIIRSLAEDDLSIMGANFRQ